MKRLGMVIMTILIGILNGRVKMHGSGIPY